MTLALEDPPVTSRSTQHSALVTSCSHCGLPVPAGLIEPDTSEQFCCNGCKTVYTVIHSCRVDQYYAYLKRDRDSGGTSSPAKITGKAYREFDDPAFLDLHAPLSPSTNTRTIDFYLEGVHCAACVWLVEKLPALLPHVLEARLNLGKQLLRITWVDGGSIENRESGGGKIENLSSIARMLDSLGYPPHPAHSSTARQIRTLGDRRQLIRIGVAGACAGNTMLLGTALYAGLFATMDPACILLFRYLSMALGILSLAWPGSTFFRGAWAALRTRTPHLDLPIALGLGAGGIAGIVNTLLNTGEIYFDSLSVLVFLLLVGRFLQRRQQAVSEDAVELLFSLTPMSARRVADGTTEEVPITSLVLGDIVEVLPGESMPVDGQLLPGHQTTADESLLTGESMPRRKDPDSLVHAGTTNLSSPVHVRVLATGESTRVGKLMRLVTECSRRKAPMILFADRIAGYFLVGVLAIAIAVCAGWWIAGTHAAAINHAVAILIVACPCALGLATPLAVTIAIGRAARRGILIKGGETLERLARPGLLLLDKTGTLTTGKMSLQLWEGDDQTRAAVAAIEQHATHPIARALATSAPGIATEISQQTSGISGVVNAIRYWIGTPRFIQTHCTISTPWQHHIQTAAARGLSPVVVARQTPSGQTSVCAVAGIGDTIRPDVPQALAALRAAGWQLAILSGDHPAVVARVASELGITDAQGGLLPEQKLAIVQSHIANQKSKIKNQNCHPVVMVGDGINDAAALAAASVGIAVHGGAEASLAAASIYLSIPGLMPIAQIVQASHKTLSVIRRSLIASLTYNSFTITLAAMGLINPLVAAILMPISSLTVLSLAFTVKTFEKPKAGAP